jgi:hypothetical protein
MSEKFESTINSHLDRIQAKFAKQISGNDINASTYNTKNPKDNTLDDFSNLRIPKVPLVHRQSTTYIAGPLLELRLVAGV